MCTAALGTAIADSLECLTECNPRAILLRPRPPWIEDSGEHPRGDQRWSEARAFLICPVNDLDRRIGLVARFDKGAQRLDGGENPEHSVEFAARWLRIQMAAHQDRRYVGS